MKNRFVWLATQFVCMSPAITNKVKRNTTRFIWKESDGVVSVRRVNYSPDQPRDLRRIAMAKTAEQEKKDRENAAERLTWTEDQIKIVKKGEAKPK